MNSETTRARESDDELRDAIRYMQVQWIQLHSWTMLVYLVLILWGGISVGLVSRPNVSALLWWLAPWGAAGVVTAAGLGKRVRSDPGAYARLMRLWDALRARPTEITRWRAFLTSILRHGFATHSGDTLVMCAIFGSVAVVAFLSGPATAILSMLVFYVALNLAWPVVRRRLITLLWS